MKHMKKEIRFFAGSVLSLLALLGCASQHPKPQLGVTQFRFGFSCENYRIRSISSANKTESYNELLGQDLMAVDFDQDCIMDCIVFGEVSLTDAQEIYEFGLNQVARQKKLKVRVPAGASYVHETNDTIYEIKSFRPTNEHPFNQFKIKDKRPLVAHEIIVTVDRDADGVLDEVLKGDIALKNAQAQYADAINAGLEAQQLLNNGNVILVKEHN